MSRGHFFASVPLILVMLVGFALSSVADRFVDDPSLNFSGSLPFTNIFDKETGSTAANFHAGSYKGCCVC